MYLSPVAVTPQPFQSHLLEQLAVARHRGHHRNLLVSATGTGKTVMAALDYARLRAQLPALACCSSRTGPRSSTRAKPRSATSMRDPNFGEQWIGGARPQRFEHVFASVQSLNVADLDHLAPDQFDVVIVDEFHHAAAPSYERLLQHLEPTELLGLTATPERADGLPVLDWFDGRIAAELRLWDAIDQHYLTPFAYYGVHDGLDLRDVPWRRGAGYDVEALTNLFTASDVWAQQVVKEFADRVDDLGSVRALGFCVSVEHARYMARVFSDAGIESVAVWGDTPAEERSAALRALDDGSGPGAVLRRPVQRGRRSAQRRHVAHAAPHGKPDDLPAATGPRTAPGTRQSGVHRARLRRPASPRVPLRPPLPHVARRHPQGPGGTGRSRVPVPPRGLPHGARREVVGDRAESIRSAIPSRWPQKVEELRLLVNEGHPATLSSYLDHTGLELEDVYTGNRGWSDLCVAAGVGVEPEGPAEAALRRSVGRLLHVDDDVRLAGYRDLLSDDAVPRVDEMDERDQRGVRMLVSQMVDQVSREILPAGSSLQDGLDLLWQHPQVRAESVELMGALDDRVDHVHARLPERPDVPLLVHARYTRLEILSAFGHGDGARVASWQSGVIWLPDEAVDLFAVTLDKTGSSFSPTTRYRDYALSRTLFHWESQAATRQDSPTGQRYQHHEQRGSSVLLFARERPTDRAFWCLGPATYVRHEGETPMAVTWRLEFPLPGDLFARFAVAVA